MEALKHVGRAVAWLVVAVVAAALLAQPGGPLGPPAFAATAALTVSGDVRGLAPGTPGALVLTVANPTSQSVMVGSLTATAVGGGAAGCGPEAVTVQPWQGELQVPAGGTASAQLTITVDDVDACHGQSWTLQYAAS